ncbi:MAG: DNA polymerase III subunit gamma/tau [Thermodesulfobacteriota bacterium]
MSYLVLARKYRPQTFEQVVNQPHVIQTLANAVATNRMAHAVLFSGPRGTGKTTIARILAKAMNCQEGPTATPCNQCQSCREITAGNSADVFEIDGASNNGVDQVRELRENIKYLPQHSRHKIYIIDEVHMLSIAAFNALLKTLEEPPGHALFFFATTEPHKIPITILSRCQRHDLKRIGLEDMVRHMQAVCAKEAISIPVESLSVIAREADGCMRDALSLLDQVISFTSGAVTHQQVLEVLGVVDRQLIFQTADAVLDRDIPKLIDIVDDLFSRGHDLKKFFGELTGHFRNLLVVKMAHRVDRLVDAPDHEIDQMRQQARRVSEIHLSQMLDNMLKEEAFVKLSSQPKLALEMTLIKTLQSRPALSIETLIEKIDTLRREFHEGAPAENPGPGARPAATVETAGNPSAPRPGTQPAPPGGGAEGRLPPLVFNGRRQGWRRPPPESGKTSVNASSKSIRPWPPRCRTAPSPS